MLTVAEGFLILVVIQAIGTGTELIPIVVRNLLETRTILQVMNSTNLKETTTFTLHIISMVLHLLIMFITPTLTDLHLTITAHHIKKEDTHQVISRCTIRISDKNRDFTQVNPHLHMIIISIIIKILPENTWSFQRPEGNEL